MQPVDEMNTSMQQNNETPATVDQSKRSRILVWAAVLVVVGVLGALVIGTAYNPLKPKTTHTANSTGQIVKYEATVSIDASGFTPAVLKIKPMTRVYFNNNDSVNHRIDVSAVAPDPNFGSKTEIAASTGYVFTFTKSGSYMFHDADNPNANGEIIVQQ